MSTFAQPTRGIGLLALLTGGVLLAGLICLILYFTIGGVWGAVNDTGNAAAALLSAALAWQFHRRMPTRRSKWAPALSWLGAMFAVIGSYLVMSGRTGWYLAGLYTSLGYALMGIWLWQASGALAAGLPRGLGRLGRFTGAFMALGVLAVPGILAGADPPQSANWWAYAGFAGGLGWTLFFPIWCLGLARQALAREAQTVSTGLAAERAEE